MVKAWSFLTLEAEDRQYVAAELYPDVPDSHYVFDNTVHNYGHVGRGDLAVLRDGELVLGAGWIDDVSTRAGRKTRLRCPACNRTGFKRRKTVSPPYLCSHCSTAFASPVQEALDIVVYVADYKRTYRAAEALLEVEELKGAYKGAAVQHSIRELDFDAARAVLENRLVAGGAWWAAEAGVRPPIPGGHALRVGKYRVGQQRFREELFSRFGAVCALSGPQPAAALQAAHLYQHRPVHVACPRRPVVAGVRGAPGLG